MSPLDVLADELGAIAGRIERELRQGFEATIAKLEARAAALELQVLRGETDRSERLAAAVAELRERPGEAGPAGQDGADGRDGADGKEGPPGRLPLCAPWEERVFYAGESVVHDGATYQAQRDTGRAPPHDDWRVIASRGADGRSFEIRGTFDETATDYRALNIVALNGSSFVAKHDNPGPCPGDGWQLLASAGKRGDRGAQGEGKRGDPGAPAPKIVGGTVDPKTLSLVLSLQDGSSVEVDLYPLADAIRGAL